MKLLYASAIVLITLVVAVQNFKLQNAAPFERLSTYCSSECEFEYLTPIFPVNSMWANFYFPLPTSQEKWESTCSVITQFLNCSVEATVGCREERPPMVRLAQVKNAYGYLCGEGAQQFLAVLPCLGKHYDQMVINKCVMERKSRARRGPDADLCNELKNTYDCTVENVEKNCVYVK